MSAHLRVAVAALALACSALPARARGQDLVVTLKESTLNRMAARPGQLSDSGTIWSSAILGIAGFRRCRFGGYAACAADHPASATDGLPVVLCAADDGRVLTLPAGQRIPWAWWVAAAAFTVREGVLTFTATVRGRVAGQELPAVTRTVPARIELVPGSDRLRVVISDFKVPLTHAGRVVHEVDVARLYGLTFPLGPQQIPVTLLDGSRKTITARFLGVTPTYLDRRIRLAVDVGY